MRRGLSILLFLGLIVAAALAAQRQGVQGNAAKPQSSSATLSGPIQHVLIVTVDGMKPQSYTEPDAHGLKVPTIREIVHDGAWSDGVQPVMPSVTYPSHTTMVTGVNPGIHGIFTNTAWDPLNHNYGGYRWYAEDIRVPTLWQIARERGLRTALIHWPVTVGAHTDLNVPEYWRASIPEDLKLLRALSTPGIFDEVAKESPDFSKDILPPDQTDSSWTDMACYAVEKMRPNLVLLHVAMLDHWEHEKGPFSPEANAATETADAQIARLIASARKADTWDSTILVVLSDHGFAPVSQSIRPGVLLRDHGLIALDAHDRITSWKASVLASGGSAYIYLHDTSDDATRHALLDVFQRLAGAEGSGIRRVASHEDIVAMGGDPNAFLALDAADGSMFVSGYTGNFKEPSKDGGAHGYFPDRPEMRASMLVYGPPVAAGKIENARMIDVAPTVARWLMLELGKVDGAPLAIPMRSTAR
jgi:predicted AlkP superfamily pyrophosphatase or phosphodiesterase